MSRPPRGYRYRRARARPRRRNPNTPAAKNLAATIVAGVITAILTAVVVDSLARARDAAAAKASRAALPQPVAPGQSTV